MAKKKKNKMNNKQKASKKKTASKIVAARKEFDPTSKEGKEILKVIRDSREAYEETQNQMPLTPPPPPVLKDRFGMEK